MNMARSGGFIETSKRNPCVVCGNITGHCKTKDGDRGDTLAYCHNHAHKPAGPINGQVWLKQAEDWGIFAPNNSAIAAADWMSADDRDTAFRAFLVSRSLDAADRADLHARGLTDIEIAAWDIVSLGGKQPGYFVPCYNPDGLIVGAQWRVRKPGDGSRYKWVAWLGGTKFEDELPLTVQRPVGSIPTGIAVCEGIGAKSFILAQRTGMATIGAGSDSQFIASPRHWRQYLRALSTELNTTVLTFYPDAGAVRNASVLGKYREWFDFVANLGYTVQVAWWGQAVKGESPDPDELTEDTAVKLISVAEFCAIADKESAPPKTNEFNAAIKELVRSGKSEAEIHAEAHALAAAHSIKSGVDRQVALESVAAEKEAAIVDNGFREKIERELKNRSFTVELSRLFPGPEGKKFCQWLRWKAAQLGVNPLAIVFTWLSGIASVTKQGTQVHLGGDHYANPIWWSCVVGEMGRGKTPAQKAALSPLLALHAKNQEDYQQAKKEYEAALQRYKKSGRSADGDPGDEPEAPVRPRSYVVSKATIEGLAAEQSNQPEDGLLLYRDELSGLVGGLGQYKAGKGDDRQVLLELDNGAPIDVTNKNQDKVYCKASSISITGTIQPAVIARLMGDFNDEDGFWSRQNFIMSDTNRLPAKPTQDIPPDYTDWLSGIYKRVSNFAPRKYGVDKLAFDDLYVKYWEALSIRILEAPRSVFGGLYSKARNKVGRAALILHLMNAAIERTEPAATVDYNTMSAAVDIVNMSLNQAHQLIERGDEEMGGTEAVCAAIWRYVDRRPDKASDWQAISRGVSALRPKPGSKKGERINGKSSVMEFLRLLEQSGCGQFLGDGRFMVSSLEPAKPAESTEGLAAEEVPLPDFVPDVEPEEATEPEPTADEPVVNEVIGMGDRVIITEGEHHGGFATVTEITDDYARVQEPGGHRSIPDLNALIPLAHLLKHTEARASEWRRKSREI